MLRNGCRRFPDLVEHDFIPRLAFHTPARDGLADGDSTETTVAGGKACADGSRVIHRPPDVRSWINPRDKKIEWFTECTETTHEGAKPGRSGDRP